MATNYMFRPLSTCLASTSLSPEQASGRRRHKKAAIQCKSHVYRPRSIAEVRRAPPPTPGVFQDLWDIKHIEKIAEVKNILTKIDDPLESMMTINSIQRLGIDYHFKEEIEATLGSIYKNFDGGDEDDRTDNLLEVSLFFRLMRQAGYFISSDVFNKFVDKKGRFRSSLRRDVRGLLSLHEASYLNTGEEMLDKANEFSAENLKSFTRNLESDAARSVRQTLNHPYHMTLPRYNASLNLRRRRRRRRGESGRNGIMEEVARLDFNLVQSLHQGELEQVLSWWRSTGLAQELSFARDQPLKWYLWPMTMIPDPHFSKFRIELTKVVAFIYIIDDIFDVYGSLEELSLFTEAIKEWDLSAIQPLPGYMQICYTVLYNFTNEIAPEVFKEQGWNPIDSLKKTWTRLCSAFLLESKWFRSKHVPKADEYLRNGVISSGLHVVLVHLYFLLGHGITEENVNFLEGNAALISCPATILRLRDDLGSAEDENQEGFDGSYVECYMREHPNSSAQSARDHVMGMMSDSWQSLNRECFSESHFSPDFVAASLNSARMVEVMYSYDEDQNLPILEDYINMLLLKDI